MKDFVRKSLIAQGEKWFKSISSDEWCLVIDHPWCDEDNYHPNYWSERAMDLCEFKITRSYFGLSFLDLMDMDPNTFIRLEERIHKIARKQTEEIPKQIKDELNKPV